MSLPNKTPSLNSTNGIKSSLIKRLWLGHWPIVAMVIVIIVAFFPIFLLHKTLLTSSQTAGIMGSLPPWGTGPTVPTSGKYLLDPGASAWQDEPMTEKASWQYRHGIVPLWNSSIGLGKPLAAAMQSAVFTPLRLPLFISPNPLMWDIFLLGRLMLAMVLTFYYLRTINLDKISSLVGAVTFGLSGYFMLFVTAVHLNVEIFIPLLLLSLERAIRMQPKSWLWIAITVFLLIVGGQPEAAILVLTFGLIYFFIRLIQASEQWGKKIQPVIVGMIIGTGFGAPLLLPFLEFLPYAYTSHAPDSNVSLGADPPQLLRNLFYPYFFGLPYRPWGRLWGMWSGTRQYVGIGVLILSLFALFDWRKNRYVIIFLTLLVLGIAKEYGLVNYDWLTKIPYYNAIAFQKYLGPWIAFAFSALGAVGFGYIYTNKNPKIYSFIIVGLALVAISMPLYRYWPLIPSGFKPLVAAQFIVPLTYLFGLIIAAITIRNKPENYKNIITVLALGVIFEMVILVPKEWPARTNPYKEPPYVSFLKQDPTARIFGLDYLLYPQTASVYNLHDIRDLDAVFVTHYFRYIQEFINPSIVDRYTGHRENDAKENLPTRYLRNPMFDLLGVRYILTTTSKITESTDLVTQLTNNVDTPAVRLTTFTINGQKKSVLFQHPENSLYARVRPQDQDANISFAIGLDPESWDKAGDGVRFLIRVDGEDDPLFDQTINPKTNHEDRKWHAANISLAKYAGQDIGLTFATQAGANNMFDFAGWGDLKLNNKTKLDNQYNLVYDHEIKIYQNTHAYPRAFLVGNVVSFNNEESVIKALKSVDFSPRRTAVIKYPQPLQDKLTNGAEIPFDRVKIIRDQDNQVALEVDAPYQSLLILSDTFYPGWQVYIDDQKSTILQTNLALRGVIVNQGKHKVVFRYQPSSYYLGVAVAMTYLTIGLLLLVGRKLYMVKKKQRGI